jgi:N-acetylmuramoyl-L-alanine amidase
LEKHPAPMPATSRILRGYPKTLVTLTGFLLALVLFSTPAFAKTKKHRHRARIYRHHTTLYAPPPRIVPAARNFTTVVIDAGHGGADPGGIAGQRYPEKPYTLDTAIRLRAILERDGLRTVMTRTNDTFISLPERVRIADTQHNAIFVSIHFNSSPNSSGYGLETYYYAANARPLADRIQARILSTLPTQNRGVKSRGYYVLRKPSIPAVLVEGGFLTNPDDARKILTPDFRQKLALSIAQAIMDQRNH